MNLLEMDASTVDAIRSIRELCWGAWMRTGSREWDESYFASLMEALWHVLANEPVPEGCWRRMEGSVSGSTSRPGDSPEPAGDGFEDEVRRLGSISGRALRLAIPNWEGNFLLSLGRVLDLLAGGRAIPRWHLDAMADALGMED